MNDELKLSAEATAQFVLALQNALLTGSDVSDYLRAVRFTVVNDELFPLEVSGEQEDCAFDDDDSFDDLT